MSVATIVAAIQSVTWTNYPSVATVAIWQPVGAAQLQGVAQATAPIRVVLRGVISTASINGPVGAPIEKHFMCFGAEPSAAVTAVCQGAGTLLGAMAAGTDTPAEHAAVDRNYTLVLTGIQVQ